MDGGAHFVFGLVQEVPDRIDEAVPIPVVLTLIVTEDRHILPVT